MDYSQFGFPLDSTYTTANGYQHASAPFSQHQFNGFGNMPDEIPKPEIYFPTGYPPDLLDDVDDGDAEGKSRLTSDQMNELEREFKLNPKPKTQYKQRVATRLRLNLPRVNVSTNWYQNRRAKAKHQRPSAREYDGSSNDDTFTSPESAFANVKPEMTASAPGAHASHQPIDFSASLSAGFDLGPLDGPFAGFDFGLDLPSDHTKLSPHEHLTADRLRNTRLPHQHISDESPLWSNDDFSASVPRPLASSAAGRQGSHTHSPQSSTGAPAYERGCESLQKSFDAASVSMYHGALFNQNLSTHDLTNSSSENDWSNLITPPTDTNPNLVASQLDTPQLPWMVNEPHTRRTSESSELATTFATNCQVHQSPTGSSGPDATVNPSTVFQRSAGASPPVLTPNVSPDPAAARAASNVPDLASRRKAQRPEPLVRPVTNRSHSYGGPQSMSPQLKGPSRGVRPSQSSTVLNGRVSKPGSAQASPRHLQTHFDVRPPQREPPMHAYNDSTVSAMTASNLGSYTQPSSANSVQSSAAQWQHSLPGSDSGLPVAQLYSNPNAYSSVPDLSANAAQTQINLVQHPLPHRSLPTQSSEYDLPQSAPSHQTTFQLPESPASQINVFAAQRWPLAQHNANDFDLHLPQQMVPRVNGHTLHHSFGTGGSNVWQPPFAPKVHPGALPGQYNFAAWNQHPMNFAAAPAPPEREFKVEMSVKTKPDQIFVKPTSNDFNFHYSTPTTMEADLDKKK